MTKFIYRQLSVLHKFSWVSENAWHHIREGQQEKSTTAASITQEHLLRIYLKRYISKSL